MSSKYDKKYGSLARKRKVNEDTDTSTGERVEEKRKSRRREERNADSDDDGDKKGGSSKEAISMSVEETNKLRAELGLAPLEVNDEANEESNEGKTHESGGTIHKDFMFTAGREFVHKPADSWTKRKEEERMREKLEAARNKRIALAKLSKNKALGEEDGDDDALRWVERMREEERRKAEERARLLDTMDEEFTTAEEKSLPKKTVKKSKLSKVKNELGALAGIEVEHDPDELLDAEQTILVLKDKSVLDDTEGETLINPTMREMEHWAHNRKLRGKKGGYQPYEEESVDDWGKVKEARLLGKYDDEEWMSAPQRQKFRLDEEGTLKISEDKQRQMIKEKLRLAQEISLESKGYTIANEYYTPEEMEAKFKKKSKKGNMRGKKGKRLRASELLADAPEEAKAGNDLGRRQCSAEREDEKDERPLPEAFRQNGAAKFAPAAMSAIVDKSRLQAALQSDDEEEDSSDEEEADNNDLDLKNVLVDDDAEDELQAQLSKTRRLAQTIKQEQEAGEGTKPMRGVNRVNMLLQSIKNEPVDEDVELVEPSGSGKTLVLDSVAEYVKNLGDVALAEEKERYEEEERVAKQEAEQKPDSDDGDAVVVHKEKRSRTTRRGVGSSTAKGTKGKWVEDIEDSTRVKDEEMDSEEEMEAAVLGKEANLALGAAAALQHAMQKGYLNEDAVKTETEEEKGQRKLIKYGNLMSRNYRKDNSGEYEIEDKYKKKLDYVNSRGGPVRPFVEKDGYNPDVGPSYTDSHGQPLSQKEAWRQLCWKFHGRYPSHKQVEKRQRQKIQQAHVTQMDSLDTPLGTLSKQNKVQSELQQPFIVLDKSSAEITGGLKKET